MVKSKIFIPRFSWVFFMIMLFCFTKYSYAQQYIWANAKGASNDVRATSIMSVRPDGVAEAFYDINGGTGLFYAVGPTNLSSPFNNASVLWDGTTGSVITNQGVPFTSSSVFDPQNSNIRYSIGFAQFSQPFNAASGPLVVSPQVSFSGWTFNIPNMPQVYGASKFATYVTKYTRAGNNWNLNWVRWICSDSLRGIFSASAGSNLENYNSFGGVEFVNFKLTATVVSGATKLAVGFRAYNMSSEDINVYSNGTTTAGLTNNSSHKILASSGTSLSGGSPYAAIQIDGLSGNPEFLSTISPSSNFTPNFPMWLSYSGSNLLMHPYMQPNSINNTNFLYRCYTNTSGTPSSQQALGGWVTSGNVPRYALLKVDAVNGNYIDGYIDNLSAASGTATNFIPGYMEVDKDYAYIIGTTSSPTANLVYDPDGTGPLASLPASQARDYVIVKILHSGGAGTLRPVLSSLYGGSGQDSIINKQGFLEFKYSAIDTISNKLYFLMRAASSFTNGGANVHVNTGDGKADVVLQINTANLNAVRAISLVGTSTDNSRNTVLKNTIQSIGINQQNGRLYLSGNFYAAAQLRVNASVLKNLSFFNRIPPSMDRAGDGFFVTVDSTLSNPIPTDPDISNVYSRSTSSVTKTVVNSDGNPIYLGTFNGDFTWNATSQGGTSGTLTSANFPTDIIILADKNSGNVLDATSSVSNGFNSTRQLTIHDAKINPFDGMLYVLYSAFSSIAVQAVGKNSPTIQFTPTPGSFNRAGYVTKLDPKTLQHSWTKVIAPRRHIENDSVARNGNYVYTYPSSIDFNNTNGDIFIAGYTSSEGLYISTNNLTANTTPALLNVYPSNTTGNPTIGFTFVTSTTSWGFSQSGNPNSNIEGNPSNFFLKLSNSGLFQFGGTFGYNNVSSFFNPQIAYSNNSFFVSLSPTASGNVVFNANGYQRPSNTVNGSSVVSITSANRSGMLKFDASAPSAPTAVSNLGTRPVFITDIVSDQITNKLFAAGNFTGTASFGGTSVTSSGQDVIIWELDQSSLEDVATGNIRVGGSASEVVNEINLDQSGNLYYCGSSNSSGFTITTPGGSIPVSGSQGGTDYLVGSTDPNNSYKPIFCFVNGSPNNEICQSVSSGDFGTIFLGGDLKGTATFGTSSIVGNTSGDLLFGRIDYPFIGPGGINSSLDHWFDASYGVVLTGSNIDSLRNKNAPTTPNSNLPKLQKLGTVPYFSPSFSNPNVNFYSSFLVSSGNQLIYPSIGAGTFTNNGNRVVLFAIAKPSASASEIFSWSEPGGNNLILRANGATRTTSSGISNINATLPATSNKWSLITLVQGTGTTADSLDLFINNRRNGRVRSLGNLNTASNGTLLIGNGPGAELAEVASYSFPYTTGSTQFNRITSYLALKYGVSLDTIMPYVNSKGQSIYNHTPTGAESQFKRDIFGLMRDDAALLNQKQGVASNNKILTIAVGDTIVSSQLNHPATLNDGEYLIIGSNDSTNTINTDFVSSISTDFGICAGFNIGRKWLAKLSLPYNSRSQSLKQTRLRFRLSEIPGMTAANNAFAGNPSSYYLLIDRNSNGVFTDSGDEVLTADSLIQTAGVDDVVVFKNIEMDNDGSGSDQFTLAWKTDGVEPAFFTTNGNTGNMASFCGVGNQRYYRDPSIASKSYVLLNPNGNSSFNPSFVSVERMAAPLDKTTSTLSARLMNYIVRVTAAGTFNTNGGVRVRIYYDSAVLAATKDFYSGVGSRNTWIKYDIGSGTESDLINAFNADPSLPLAQAINPVNSGITAQGVHWVEFITTSFSSFSYYSANSLRVLPVKLAWFNGSFKNCDASLNWKSSEEVNLSHFIVQYSIDGVNFQDVQELKAKGSETVYSFSHTPQVNGTVFYRLKAVNSDLTHEYSSIIKLNASCKTSKISINPNPVQFGGVIRLEVTGFLETLNFELYNSQGQIVKKMTVNEGVNNISINTLPSGVYMVRVFDEKGFNYNSKIVIQ